MKLLALVLAACLCSGCALFTKPADTVSFDRMGLALMRGDIKASIVALEMRLSDACKTKKLSAETCGQVERLLERAREIDERLVTALMDQKTEVNWTEIIKVMKLVVDIAMKMV